MFPSSEVSYLKTRPKTTENRRIWVQETDLCAYQMGEASMRLGHCSCTSGMAFSLMSNAHYPCAPCIWKRGAQLSFPVDILGKSRTFSPNLGRNSYYKYQPSSFKISRSKLWQFKRKETLELRDSFYLLLDFLGYVFIFSNLFLVTMCN